MASLQKDAPIIIIGAGVFGLSTALHLGQRGYTNVTVFDKQDYDKSLYSYELGADAASADVNKILRCAYGSDTIYQNLALEALEVWKEWNNELAESTDLPSGLSREDKLYVNSGTLSIVDREELPSFEQQSLENITAAGKGHTQFVVSKDEDVTRAKSLGFRYAVDPFNRKARGKLYGGLLDTSGGLTCADKACLFALHKARLLGVRFIFGVKGTFASFVYAGSDPNEISGIRTVDGLEHLGSLIIVAGGGWTPTIVPELDGLCETTAGSVFFYQIPRQSPLWDRFASSNFPSYAWGMRDGAKGGIYGFPRDGKGVLKIGYRGTKYTNPVVQADGIERSIPTTSWSHPEKMTSVPSQALQVVQDFVAEYLPELVEQRIPLAKSRLCWYNDSFDNNLVVDRVPSKKNLMVATGGSGHGFKYLPVLGKWIVNIIENKELKGDDVEIAQRWKWRSLEVGVVPVNSLMQGSKGDRSFSRTNKSDI